MIEKNYCFPITLIGILEIKKEIILNKLIFKLLDIEIYKMFYGETIVEKYFSLNENKDLKNFIALYGLCYITYYFSLILNKTLFNIEDNMLTIKYDKIPEKLKGNFKEIKEIF